MLERRTFTIDEAQRTLPLVERIVTDIVSVAADLKRQEAPRAARKIRSAAADETVERLHARLRKYAQELDELGVELKDPFLGLVDYTWRRGSETAYLCWKHGEEGIGFWHDLEAGYGGRQPIDPVDRSLDGGG